MHFLMYATCPVQFIPLDNVRALRNSAISSQFYDWTTVWKLCARDFVLLHSTLLALGPKIILSSIHWHWDFFNLGKSTEVTHVYQGYIHSVPVILHDNLQRESHKPDGRPTSVT